MLNRAGNGRWEVDGSGLLIEKVGQQWRVLIRYVVDTEMNYLGKHQLQGQRFPSRARAVDAVRLALQVEPLSLGSVSVQWVKQEEGVYHSQDGRWQLTQETSSSRIIPLNQRERALFLSSRVLTKFLRIDRSTLRACGLHAEMLARLAARRNITSPELIPGSRVEPSR